MMKPMTKLIQARWEQKKVWSQNNHKGLDQMNWMSNKNVDDELTFNQ